MNEYDVWNGVTMKYEGSVGTRSTEEAMNYAREQGTPAPIVCEVSETRSPDPNREFSRLYA